MEELRTYTDYECLPPISVTDFDKNLRAGTLETAFPWTTISSLNVNRSSRLGFNQSLSFDYMIGTLVAVENGKTMNRRDADPLTGTRFMLNLVKRLPGQRPKTEYMKNLIALNENHFLYRITSENFEWVKSKVFRGLIQPGALVFTHDVGALILSFDRRFVSICPKIREYQNTDPRFDWFLTKPVQLNSEVVSKVAFHFTQDATVAAMLKCDELLAFHGI